MIQALCVITWVDKVEMVLALLELAHSYNGEALKRDL